MNRTQVISAANGLLDNWRPNALQLNARGVSVGVSDGVSVIQVSGLPGEPSPDIALEFDEASAAIGCDGEFVFVDADRLAKLMQVISELVPLRNGTPVVRVYCGKFGKVPTLFVDSPCNDDFPSVHAALAGVKISTSANCSACRMQGSTEDDDAEDDFDDK